MSMRMGVLVVSLSAFAALSGSGVRAQVAPAPADPRAVPAPDCGFAEAARATAAYLAAVRRGEIVPRVPPAIAPRRHAPGEPGAAGPSGAHAPPGTSVADDVSPDVTPEDLFLYEDSASLLTTDWDFADLLELMVDAANALMLEHGDEFDFVGYWLCFEPKTTFGAAFYLPVENDVLGIGDVGDVVGEPGPLFMLRPDYGLAGDEIEGLVMMWNIDSGFWAPGIGPEADFTRLVLGQEFEHRFGLFLPPLAGGLALQGDDVDCGRTSHWNWAVDGQGSSMEISDWTGAAPALLDASSVSFNTDIPGGVWSWSDLYLMGYATPAEMDAGNSELRYMVGSDCDSVHAGAIMDFDSSDIIAAAGPRVPPAAAEDKAYRTGWVVLHLPGEPPLATQLDDIAAILTQHQVDWATSTLSLGSMDDKLPVPPAFMVLEGALAGAAGLPSLLGEGPLEAGCPVTLTLTGVAANAVAALVIGFDFLGAPLKGGVLVPDADVLIAGLPTGPAGSIVITAAWPPGLPSGFETWYQYWIIDPLGPMGYAASNGLLGTTP